MKRISALLLLTLGLNGCDDGDLIFDEFNFDDVPVSRCDETESDVLYKLNGSEVLVLQINDLITTLPNEPTPENVPDSLLIDGTVNRLVYRLYESEAIQANICDAIQPPTPRVNEQWNAIAGTVKITTTAVKTVYPATHPTLAGGEEITDLRHAIIITDILFQTPNNQVVEDTIAFGNRDVAFDAPSINSIGGTPAYCNLASPATFDLIHKFNASTVFTINIDPALLSTDSSTLNTPKTGVINGEMNRVIYRRFDSFNPTSIAPATFCTDYPALSPAIIAASETWTSVNGVDGVSGIVEVTTTSFGANGFQHTIRLKNVYLQNASGTLSFKIADDYLYGVYQQ